MKRIYTLLLALLMGAGAQAQVIITQADMPVSGDSLRYSIADAQTVALPTQAGQGLTWDYSTLVPIAQGLDQYKSATNIGLIYALFFGFQGYGLKVQDTIGLGPVEVYDVYDFYHRTAQNFSVTGRAVTFQGIPLPATYSDADEVYTFPLQFGDVDSTTFRVQFNAAGQGTVTQRGSRTNRVLGEGQLTTPFGTYQAIMVRVDVQEDDSIQSAQIPFPLPPIPRNTSRLVWLANGQKIPLLEMGLGTDLTGQPVVTDVRYRDIRRVVVPVAPQPDFEALQQVLNVGDSTFFINLTSVQQSGVGFSWDLTPPTGWNFAFGTSASSRNPVIKFTTPGLYTVSLRATVAGVSADTVKVDYITVNDPSGVQASLGAGLRLYPNPANTYTELAGAGTASQDWRWIDASGRSTSARTTVLGNKIRFDTRNLAPGLYILRTTPGIGDKACQLRISITR